MLSGSKRLVGWVLMYTLQPQLLTGSSYTPGIKEPEPLWNVSKEVTEKGLHARHVFHSALAETRRRSYFGRAECSEGQRGRRALIRAAIRRGPPGGSRMKTRLKLKPRLSTWTTRCRVNIRPTAMDWGNQWCIITVCVCMYMYIYVHIYIYTHACWWSSRTQRMRFWSIAHGNSQPNHLLLGWRGLARLIGD